MRYRPIIAAALILLAAPVSTMASSPQQPVPTRPVKPLNNDMLLEAYKQSISDASHGRYIDASYGLLRKLGVERVEETADPDVVDQWAQVMSTMTGVPTFTPPRAPISTSRMSSSQRFDHPVVRLLFGKSSGAPARHASSFSMRTTLIHAGGHLAWRLLARFAR